MLWILSVMACSTEVMSQDAPTKPQKVIESVFLETDATATRKLAAVEGYLAARQWEEAIQLVTQLLAEPSSKLVPVGRGRYVNLRLRCNTLLASMDTAGLQVLRRRLDPRAAKWLEIGIRQNNAETLLKIVDDAFLSSSGDDALVALGDFAFESGAVGEARGYWERALPIEVDVPAGTPLPVLTYPDTDLNRAEIRARLVMSNLPMQDFDQFESDLAAFSERHRDATGSIAGRKGNLVEILRILGQDKDHWSHPNSNAEGKTFAGNSKRNLIYQNDVRTIGALQWFVPLTPAPVRQPQQVYIPSSSKLAHFPVVQNGKIFVNDAERILALNLHTGKPVWGDEPEEAVIYPDLTPLEKTNRDSALKTGLPRFTMTLDQGHLYARMGSPVTGKGRVTEFTRSASRLVCLDVNTGQGKLLWAVDADDIFPRETGWEFEGSPVVQQGRLYAAMRKSAAQPQFHVVCFETESGNVLWNSMVCTALSRLGERVHEISHHLLTLAGGMLFYATDQGAIAAINARNGNLNWVVTYEAQKQNNWTRQLKNALSPCLYHAGTILVAPADMNEVADEARDGRLYWQSQTRGTLIALDAISGIRKWTRELRGGARHLLGVHQGQLIVAGDYLWSIDVETGRVRWKNGHHDVESFSYGRGLIADGRVYWPKHESIWVLDATNGRTEGEILIHSRLDNGSGQLTGGNLTIAGGLLIIAQGDGLAAYSSGGQRRRQPRREFSLRD